MLTEIDLIAIGPLVELQMITVADFPEGGGSAAILATEKTIGCDAPIVAATVSSKRRKVGIVANSISDTKINPIRRWCEMHDIKGVTISDTINQSVIGIDCTKIRKRLYLTPEKLQVATRHLLNVPTRFVYIDWYPEIRNWFTVDNLIQIAAGTRLWINLARHYDDASLDSLANAEAELVQVSLRCGNADTHEIVKKIFNTTNVQSVIATFGCAGSAIYRRNGEKHRRVPREPIPGNRSGAGAIFIGAIMSNIMLGQSWEDAQTNATDTASAFVSRQASVDVPDIAL
jgi:pfkB family carbohydrate kinase